MQTERGEAKCRNAELQNFSSKEENNSLELLKENKKVGVTLDQRLMVLPSTLGCPGWGGLMNEGNKGLVFHWMW